MNAVTGHAFSSAAALWDSLARTRPGPELTAMQRSPMQPSDDATVERARQTARQFVGEAFFGMLMKAMRKGLSEDHPLHGGAGESIMQGQLDQAFIERMATSRNFRLADAVVDRVYRNTRHSPLVSPGMAGAGRTSGWEEIG